MKHALWVALLALALPVAAVASSIDFTNSGGTLTGGTGGLSLTGSVLVAINGFNQTLTTGDLGSVSFTTGPLTSGSLQYGGTFGAGGSFTIDWNGGHGLPAGTIFSGTFSGPVTWTLITLANGTHEYTLTGTITGTWYNGLTAYGATVQLTFNTKKAYFNGQSIGLSSGDSNITVAPEPGTLGLLGTGLVGLAGLVRRKMKA
jgi:hypothetical protein